MRGTTITGVNLFILISGYFGIKLRWRTLLDLLVMVMAFSLLSEAGACLLSHSAAELDVKSLIGIVFPLSANGQYWFITCYFYLMLMSPVLNRGLAALSDRECLLLMGLLIYANCFGGYVLQAIFNPTGYNVVHMMFVYMLGYMVRRFGVAARMNMRRWVCVWLSATVAIVAMYACSRSNRALDYNNPLIVVAATALFCIFVKIRFSSRRINIIGRRMVAVYLLQLGAFGEIILRELSRVAMPDRWYWIPVYLAALFSLALSIEAWRERAMGPVVCRLSDWISGKIGRISISESIKRSENDEKKS